MCYEKNGYHMREPIAKLGDIIQVKGYGSRKFEVFYVSYTLEVDAVEEFDEILYEVSEINGEEIMMAWQEDIVVLETPHEVDYERLEELSAKMFKDVLRTVDLTMGSLFGGEDKAEKEASEMRKKAKEERTRAERIDYMLTLLSDYTALVELFGEDYEEGDKYYAKKIDHINAELANLTRKEE